MLVISSVSISVFLLHLKGGGLSENGIKIACRYIRFFIRVFILILCYSSDYILHEEIGSAIQSPMRIFNNYFFVVTHI